MKVSSRLYAAVRAKIRSQNGRGKAPRLVVSRVGSARLRNVSPRKTANIVIKPPANAQHPALQVSDAAQGVRVVENFTQLHLRKDVSQALSSIGVVQPTVIQMLAIPKIQRGKNVLCAAETGSGKTIAYLAPLISRLRNEEENHGVIPRLKRPRALILLPSRDLAAQVLSVSKSLCHEARFRAVGLIGGTKRRFIKESLDKPVDVAIATPDSLLKYRREQRLFLSDINHLIIDEADTLFDESFASATVSILKSIKIRNKKPANLLDIGEGAQVTIVGATLSSEMLKKIKTLIPNIQTVSSKGLHQILPHVEQKFMKLRQNEKAEKLLSLLQHNRSDAVIVFCNTVPSCDWTAHYLTSNNIPVIKLHGGFSPMDRKNILKEFQKGSARVLVCTDIASRGIDSTHVGHVILFDFPLSLPDYLHRVGRTGRVGSTAVKCKATSFMTHKRDVRMAMQIKDASERRDAIMNKRVVEHLQSPQRIYEANRSSDDHVRTRRRAQVA